MRAFTGFERAVGRQAHVVYLQSAGRYWRGTAEELKYIARVVDDVAKRRMGDASNVFVFGWSSGAHLAQAYACGNQSVVAVALCEGRVVQACPTPTKTLVLHNTGDQEHRVEKGDALVQAMRSRASCTPEEGTPWKEACVLYNECVVPLAYCRVEGGSHFPWKHAASRAWSFFRER
jgi:poly(3-hydroxybutyrate) depolymerase